MVLYSDASVMVLDKPHGLAVQGGPGIVRNLDGMLDALQFEAEERPRLVHRLDRDTSGRADPRPHRPGRRLPGPGLPRPGGGEDLLGRGGAAAGDGGRPDRAGPGQEGGPRGERMRGGGRPRGGARAITEFRTLDNAKRRAAWLELKPYTGRTHQLRVHCAEGLGTPILGDGKYGGAAAHMDGLSNQLHLHARALRLPHPEGGMLEAAAHLSPHMKETFDFFGFESPKTPKPRRLALVSKR